MPITEHQKAIERGEKPLDSVPEDKRLPLPPHVMRPMLVTDLNRIMADYIKHYRACMRGHEQAVYSAGMQRRFARLARKQKILVAADPTKEAVSEKRDVLGWLMYTPWDDKAVIIHYIYVRAPYREQGLAREMLKQTNWQKDFPIVSSHRYRLPRQLIRRYNVIINEFILEEIQGWNIAN